MSVKRTVLSGALVSVLVVAGGCAGLGGPSDEELISAVVEKWAAAMVKPDVDVVLETYSENFSHYEVPDKASLEEFLNQAVEMGYLEDAEVYLEDAETEIDPEAGTAMVYPIDLSSSAGYVTIELNLAKEEDAGWLITGMDIEGL